MQAWCRYSTTHVPAIVLLFCGHFPYSKAVILPPQPQPLAVIVPSLCCHCPNIFRTFSTKQSKITKQSLLLCTPSKVRNTLTQGSLYCKSSCYACHMLPYSVYYPAFTLTFIKSHSTFKTQTQCLVSSSLALATLPTIQDNMVGHSNALYSVDWRTSLRTQDLALCSTIHLHQMHQKAFKEYQQVSSTHYRLRLNF